MLLPSVVTMLWLGRANEFALLSLSAMLLPSVVTMLWLGRANEFALLSLSAMFIYNY